MASIDTTWERIDLPVLKFVRNFPYELRWRFDRKGATEELPEFEGEELDEALRRLEEHGLIRWGDRTETSGYFFFSRLRLAPNGLRVLGEWPPSDQAELGTVLVHILRELAGEAENDGEEAKPLRRAAGAVARLGGDVVFGVAKTELGRVGGDIAS
jgi:hypothetical protein